MIIDTHCHLDDMRYVADLDDVIQAAKQAGVNRYIIPGADPSTLHRAIALSEEYDEIYFAIGVHPYYAKEFNHKMFDDAIEHPKCIAIGECGLDYHRLPEDDDAKALEKKMQKEVFIEQILFANKHNKPLIVHIRDASLDALEILVKYAGPKGGVLHCFNADEQLLSLAKRNFFFGIGGVLTFQNAKKLANIYPKIPKDTLLIETDAPYLTPHPHRGKRNEPAYCVDIAYKMASLSGCQVEEIEDLTTKNANRLFGLHSS
ncbi:MAG TPA: TatD family deoxyribonuclease [Epsilonproteobacteria bacterium]|nr:TatD family deoxyribonuclease [Campylobacterota bacterium]